MKVVLLSFYSGIIERGVEVYVHNLANALASKGHEVTVYQNGPRIKGSLYKTVSLGMKTNQSKGHSQGFNLFNYESKLIWRFTKQALKDIEGANILIATNGRLQSLYSRIWCFRHRVKLVIPGQSGPGLDDRWNLFLFPDIFIALTSHQADWAKRANPFVKVEVIPNGVDINHFGKNKDRINLNLPRPIILSVGALTPIKRHELTIKAVSKLAKGSLIISGKGEQCDQLSKLGNSLLPGRFAILDSDHDKISRLYQSSDIFVYATSPWESFGIVILEALASGLGVVATDDPIRREIVGKAGVFVDPRDTNKYAKAIELCLSKKWAKIPNEQAEKYSWDKIARQYEIVLNKTI